MQYLLKNPLVNAVIHFYKKKLGLYAAAITFYTLLAIVPLVAIALGVTKGFGLDQEVKTFLLTHLQSYEIVATKVIEFAEKSLNELRGDLLTGAGILLLFWSVMQLLLYVEEALDIVFCIPEKRNISRKIVDFLALIWTAPILLIAAYAAMVFIVAHLYRLTTEFPLLSEYSSPIWGILHLFPFLLTVLALLTIYLWIPSRKPRLLEAVIGSFVAALLLYVFQYLYVHLQIGASRLGAIYGSLAAFPLFIAWVQASWMIILFGAELSSHITDQNDEGIDFNQLCIYDKKRIWLSILLILSRHFQEGKGALPVHELKKKIQLPLNSLFQALIALKNAQLITDYEETILPLKDFSELTLGDALQALEKDEKKFTTPALSISTNLIESTYHTTLMDKKINSL